MALREGTEKLFPPAFLQRLGTTGMEHWNGMSGLSAMIVLLNCFLPSGRGERNILGNIGDHKNKES